MNEWTKEKQERVKRQIGAVCRRARTEMAMTQEDVAEWLGITAEFYGRIERGHVWPSLFTMYTLALRFGVSTDEMFGLSQEAGAENPEPERKEPGTADSPRLQRTIRQLRQASPEAQHLVSRILSQLAKRSRGTAEIEPGAAETEAAP